MTPNNSTQHAPSPFPPRHSSLDNHRHSTTLPAEAEASEGYTRPGYSHGVVASHLLARGSEAETWMDFLADQSGNGSSSTSVPPVNPRPGSSERRLPRRPSQHDIDRTESSSSRSSDRKRRLTTADVPMRRPSSIRMHSTTPGTSTSDPIVLDSSPAPASTERALPPLPPPPRPPPRDNIQLTRRMSDIVLPPWQPDADVSQCPVCGRTFTFLYRKHHCRKCGRVVCATCSPHRITIPRQYIVHPPSDGSTNVIDLTGDDDTTMSTFGPFRNPALGGGEEVRVCNPCVPDPNYGPPPQYSSPSLPSPYTSQSSSSSSRLQFPPGQPPHPRAHRSSSSAHDTSRLAHAQPPRLPDVSRDSRRSSHHTWVPPLPTGQQPSRPSDLISRYTTPQTFSASHSVLSMFPRHAPPPPIPTPTRRQIAEEDECPICGEELPPAFNESLRTQHIEECIALHSGSPAPLTHTISASLPNPARARGMSGVGESSSSRQAVAARGMFPFTATEKDCVDADGNEEECVICFEEYGAGDKMARLVCWCKFHEKCIKEWWDKKGRGACPTHQLHE